MATYSWWDFSQAIETEHLQLSIKISYATASVKLIDGVCQLQQ